MRLLNTCRLCLIAGFLSQSTSADVAIVDKTTVPKEVKDGLESMKEASRQFDNIAYVASFENRMLTYLRAPKSTNPNRFGAPSEVTIEELPTPAIATGRIQVRHTLERQWVRVTPEKVSELQSSQSYASPRTYSRVGNETRILNEKSNAAVIDERREQFPPYPLDMWMPEDLFSDNFSADWVMKYAGLTKAQAAQELGKVVVVRSVLAGPDQKAVDSERKDIVIQYEFSVPSVHTVFGPLVVRRNIVLTRDAGWCPTHIEHIRNDRLYMSYDIHWVKFKETYIPDQISIKAYGPQAPRAGAANMLVKESTFKIQTDSVILGAPVASLDFNLSIPPTAKVSRLTDPAPAHKGSLRSGIRLFDTPLGIATLGVIGMSTFLARRRLRAQKAKS